MKAYVTDYSGERWLLPQATRWKLEYTSGTPCDSFWLCCPWEQGNQTDPAQWVGFTAQWEGERVFTGVVDEVEVSLSPAGRLLELSGRGMAALLLDNEALGQDYQMATLADIVGNHVAPYGISVADGANLPPVSRFSVATGSSEWSVVDDFARYHAGVAPRFDRQGRLVLANWRDDGELELGDGAAVTQLCRRNRRYGALSSVLVRDRYSAAVQPVEDERLVAQGYRARRVVTMPGRSSYKAMRYTGQFQLDRSHGQLERLEVTVAQPFCAWPGQLVRLNRSGWNHNGLFRVAETTVGMDEGGHWTRLELAGPDFMV